MEFNPIEDTLERKRWLSTCGNYRITHINMLPDCPKYKAPWYAEVQQLVNGNTVWGHAHRHGPWWSYKACEKACKSNRHRWKRFMRCENAEQAREMIEKSKVGINKFGKRTKYACKILVSPPKWIEERMPKRLRRLLPGYGKPHVRKKAIGFSDPRK